MITWQDETDIVVVGSGFAGMAAAIEAHNNGANVQIIEKMHSPGGNSIRNGGSMAVCCSGLQADLNIMDSSKLFFEDMLFAGRYLNFADKTWMVANNSRSAWEWTVDCLGVKWNSYAALYEGHRVPRSIETANVLGADIIVPALCKLNELGIVLNTSCKLESLIVNDEGRVTGVEVKDEYIFGDENSGHNRKIKVHKAVILASGGYSMDVNMRNEYDSRLNVNFDCTNHKGATGEVLREAFRIGAAGAHLSWFELSPWTSPDEKGFGCISYFAYYNYPYALVVNPFNGKRFINELADRKTQTDAIIKIGKPVIQIIDKRNVIERNLRYLYEGIARGVIKQFMNFNDLAEEYGIPANYLKTEIIRYNSYVLGGDDQDFGKPISAKALPIEEAPFYACRLWPKIHYTMGGVQTDLNGRVIRRNGDVIKGLYAAGEVVGGTFGAYRLGSTSITDCLVYGRITGELAALEKSDKNHFKCY